MMDRTSVSTILENPYIESTAWLRGNLHAHTTISDGETPPEAVIADYERRGYDFLSISDHDRLVSPETYQKGTNLSLIRGVEVTAEGPHILHVNAHDTVEPVRDRQKVLDGIQRRGGFSVLCHPNLGPRCDHFQQRSMETLEGFVGIEIYNGVVERCGGRALATDRWDILLSSGRRIWGFADDDSHRPGDVGLAWNVVQSENRSTEAIITAIRQGRFYASTGVTIRSVRVEGGEIHVQTVDAHRIRFVSGFGVIQASADSQDATYPVPEDRDLARSLRYIRAECYGIGGRCAWTQPIFIS